MNLIPYAGFADESARGYYCGFTAKERRQIDLRTDKRRAIRAYNMFKSGLDTMEISRRMGKSEPQVHKWISTVRSAKKGLPTPYEVRRR